jgi:hypothetical protein
MRLINNITNNSKQKFLKIFCFTLIMFGISSLAQAQNPTTFTVQQNLNFGSFLTSGSGGTITISNAGVRSTTGNVIAVGSSAYSAAIFQFYSGAYKLTLTSLSYSTSVTLTRVGGGGTMQVTLTALNPAIPSKGQNLNKWTTLNYTIGGTLTVGSLTANPGGNYSGSFTVTANYN